MLKVRKQYPVLGVGDYQTISCMEHVYHFQRTVQDQQAQIICNFSDSEYKTTVDSGEWKEVVLSSFDRNGNIKGKTLILPP